MFRDHELPMSPGTWPILSPEPTIHNDDFDDVFGSEPGSPAVHGSGGYGGDVFVNGNTEVSDIPRLKEKHETEGYRDGVTRGKAQRVQEGFDEGYGLGAVLGLKMGRVIGILEGVLGAVSVSAKKSQDAQWGGEKRRLEELLKNAKEELKTEKVFAREWWGEDGIWRFEIPREKEGKDVVFSDVAAAHPLLQKWQTIVDVEIQRWSLDMELMEGNEEDVVPVRQQMKADTVEQSIGSVKSDLNW
ncbi:hypothetical protein DSL72_002021 [Monilinia vaccinii-corymbosi]|uniref:Protein YAE1 n=1 Tax=Monilinia vaccinii-corymbosi TaxID=61207 RepID=A0A8A3PBI3_9HELO|nr:hypothetical protein DSL72_002021 [Monilinia vaccinii-corymbosi]